MPELPDWKDEEFSRLVACHMPASTAYRQVFKPGNSHIELSSLYVVASRKRASCSLRIQELQEALRGLPESDWKASKEELMQWLTRAIRTPLSEIDADSDLCQELKVTVSEHGETTQTKSVNKLNAVQQLAAIAQYTQPAIGNVTINNTLNLARVDSKSAAEQLAAKFALPERSSNVIEAEMIETPSKQRKVKTR